MSSLQERFQAKKPLILAFVGGLVVGPLISGVLGWQVRSTTATEMAHEASVQELVQFCAMRARKAVAEPDKLDYVERYKLAEEWAKMPWQQEPDSEVISGCSNNLSESA